MEMDPVPHAKISSAHVKGWSDLSCFNYRREQFCIFGTSLFTVSENQLKQVFSGLPVQEGNRVKAHVYDDSIYISFFNPKKMNL